MTLRVAVAGGSAAEGNPDAGLALLDRRLAAASAAGARLLVLPQGFLTGDRGRPPDEAAILSDAPMVRAVGDAARRHAVAVACGYLERCSGRVHDSALVVDERGCALANYRRTHLLADDLRQGLAPGHWLNLVPLGDVRIGILLGADLDAAEPARALTLAGATALLLPADRPARSASITAALLRARAFENGLGVAFANLDDGPGCLASTIVAPDGTVLAEAGGGIAVADLPVADRDAADRLAARRPTLYRRLAEPHPAEPPLRG